MTELKLESEISKNYAKALFETAKEFGMLNDYANQFEEVLETINSSADLKVVMSNSSVSSNKKKDILETVFDEKIHKELLNFLKILVDKGRFGEIDAVFASFMKLVDLQNNKKVVEIVSPVELSFESKSSVLFKLEHKLKSEVIPVWTIDKNLIAGLVFKFDDYVIDTSLCAKLKNLSKTLNR